ncbi:DUF2231 domain-containing protein [Erythrobacteraceae bacterium CFH 75059]|uniref:DUF2231 domain-containing protein n=1 Tax=Qipengyuania thermophila TaxID=2509361 RepID=UPI001021D29B|nr:DUF2231 domain-containing protein [Qipengyuania thermophila]TCD06669.1 DUF2231 domain-containing protein [Erythrobacteraceae bacterium CFH 75059]
MARKPHQLRDPFHDSDHYYMTDSFVAVAGHPLHAMSVAFPIALAFATLGADVFYWWTGDPFWTRAALYSSGFGFWLGVAAGITGTGELVFGPGIRRRIAVWTHFIAAVTLLSIMGANWGLRIADHEAAVLPYGILMSLLGAVMTGFAGWHGGKLVFDHQIGVSADPGKG